MTRVPLTTRGEKMLRDELQELKQVKRPRVIQAIAEAREEQGFIEGRVKDIEAKLSNAQVIDVTAIDAGGKEIGRAHV